MVDSYTVQSSAGTAQRAPGDGVVWGADWIWWLFLALAAVDAVWMVHWGWSTEGKHILVVGMVSGILLAPLAFKRYRSAPTFVLILTSTVKLLLLGNVGGLLSYLLVATNAPLVDAQLLAFDQAIGFDWQSLRGWVQVHPMVDTAFRWAYNSFMLQMVFAILIIGFKGRHAQLNELMRLYTVTLMITVLISAFYPAVGYAMPPHFYELRSGGMSMVSLGSLQGLVSIPSFHATAAVLYVYAHRGCGRWLWAMVALNILMVMSTPTHGGHYLVDVLAGVALALGAIAVARRFASARDTAHAVGFNPVARLRESHRLGTRSTRQGAY